VASSLEQVLRIRATLEDLARMELATETARLRGLERRVAEAAGEAHASRKRWFAIVERGTAADGIESEPERVAEESVWELAIWRRGRVGAWLTAQQAEVERAYGEYLDGHRERMQVESLVEMGKHLERIHEARVEQRRLDDWYQSRPRKQRSEGAGSKEAVPEAASEGASSKRRPF
jgi:hypothetical protein